MIDETLLDAEEKMEKAVSVAKDDLGGVRTGRASPAMFSSSAAIPSQRKTTTFS